MINLQLFILLISFLIFAELSYAQQSDSVWSIKGKVLSAKSLEPLEDCPVQLKNSEIWAITDSCGRFGFYGLKSTAYTLEIQDYLHIYTDTLIQKSSLQKEYVIYLQADCYFDKAKAIQDIKAQKPNLLLVGGIAPISYSKDLEFARKYNIEYYDFGCTPPAMECIKEYNQTIFEYLDNKFGKKWREEVRKDVCFLNGSIY